MWDFIFTFLASMIMAIVAYGSGAFVTGANWRRKFDLHATFAEQEYKLLEQQYGHVSALYNKAQTRLNYLDSQLDLFGGSHKVGEGEEGVLMGAKEFAHLDKNQVANSSLPIYKD